MKHSLIAWTAAALLAAALPAQAQRPMYKCTDAKGVTTYSEKVCAAEPTVLGDKPVKPDARKEAPPQDRARAANRARLSPEELKQCDALAVDIKKEDAELKARGGASKPEDERSLTANKKKYREMRCA